MRDSDLRRFKMFLLLFMLFNIAYAGKVIVANNTRITYDFGYEIQPYVANEVKFISDFVSTTFDANKFRVGFRYNINDHIRIDPHLFIDNKRQNDWAFSPGPAFRLDFTY